VGKAPTSLPPLATIPRPPSSFIRFPAHVPALAHSAPGARRYLRKEEDEGEGEETDRGEGKKKDGEV
jgi:hypothetical protein